MPDWDYRQPEIIRKEKCDKYPVLILEYTFDSGDELIEAVEYLQEHHHLSEAAQLHLDGAKSYAFPSAISAMDSIGWDASFKLSKILHPNVG